MEMFDFFHIPCFWPTENGVFPLCVEKITGRGCSVWLNGSECLCSYGEGHRMRFIVR